MKELVVKDEDELERLIETGRYYLCNYSPGHLQVHHRDGGGHYRDVQGELAETYGKLYNRWNWNCHHDVEANAAWSPGQGQIERWLQTDKVAAR